MGKWSAAIMHRHVIRYRFVGGGIPRMYCYPQAVGALAQSGPISRRRSNLCKRKKWASRRVSIMWVSLGARSRAIGRRRHTLECLPRNFWPRCPRSTYTAPRWHRNPNRRGKEHPARFTFVLETLCGQATMVGFMPSPEVIAGKGVFD